MLWEQRHLEESEDILLRKSQPADSDFEVQLDVLAFNMSEEDARLHYERY